MSQPWRGPFADARFRRLVAGQSLSTFGDTALYLTWESGPRPFAAAIAALLSIRVTESAPEPTPPGSFRTEVAAACGTCARYRCWPRSLP